MKAEQEFLSLLANDTQPNGKAQVDKVSAVRFLILDGER